LFQARPGELVFMRGTMHLAPLIRDLAIILGVAGLMTLLFHKIRQPVVLGYIIAGIVIGPHTPPFKIITDIPSIQTWAELGVIFLMFTLGLEFSFRKLAKVGGAATLTASAEVLFFLPVGYVVGRALGWTSMDSLFLGAMLSISSTTIIIKALDELKLKNRRFAELIFGALIVEDLFAILLLVLLGTLAVTHAFSALVLLTAALKLILVVGGWFITGYFLVPRFMQYVGRIGNDEMLTILSLGLCLALVVFANHFQYSTALGAFIMGSIIAESPVHRRVEKSMASLRDLFGAVFFVSIGMLIDPQVLWEQKYVVAVLCVVTIVGKILSTSIGALVSGQSLRNSLQVGFGLAQIGEFSFIIAQLGVSLKVTSDFVYPVAVAVSLVTTFTTPYLIKNSGRAAAAFEAWLPSRVRDLLNQYATQSETRSASNPGRIAPLGPILRWSVNGLTASIIFVLSSEWIMPFLHERLKIDDRIIPLLGWSAALILAAPFIWAMLTAFRMKEKFEGKSGAISLLRGLSKVFTFLWMSAMSTNFFPGKYVVFVTATTLLVALIFLHKYLESSYQWFEERFLSSFELRQSNGDAISSLSHLAPWDAHLVQMEVHPNSKLVLKTIADGAFRVRHGVNIVAIQRGRVSIVTPLPSEILLPRDELILLGTDEQVEKMKMELEDPIAIQTQSSPTVNYELRQMLLREKCPFIGKSIRQSGIREHYKAMVVGIERNGVRNINPDSDFQLFQGDLLWIAGEGSKLHKLSKAIAIKA
jgi:CPA2 family monovalent cation:H+ antiporter-2